MQKKEESNNKIFLLLQSNGSLVLDKDYLWDGCDTPELDKSIEMPPISIRKLCELVRSRNLEWPEHGEAKKLNVLLNELQASCEIIADTINEISKK